jgi:hypothetical protein
MYMRRLSPFRAGGMFFGLSFIKIKKKDHEK